MLIDGAVFLSSNLLPEGITGLRHLSRFVALQRVSFGKRSTVKLFALDGKDWSGAKVLGCRSGEYDDMRFGVFRDLSGSIALQRSVSTVCATVKVHCDAQNARQDKRLSGSEMIEWE